MLQLRRRGAMRKPVIKPWPRSKMEDYPSSADYAGNKQRCTLHAAEHSITVPKNHEPFRFQKEMLQIDQAIDDF